MAIRAPNGRKMKDIRIGGHDIQEIWVLDTSLDTPRHLNRIYRKPMDPGRFELVLTHARAGITGSTAARYWMSDQIPVFTGSGDADTVYEIDVQVQGTMKIRLTIFRQAVVQDARRYYGKLEFIIDDPPQFEAYDRGEMLDDSMFETRPASLKYEDVHVQTAWINNNVLPGQRHKWLMEFEWTPPQISG